MDTQTELELIRPSATPDQVKDLVGILHEECGWVSAAELAGILGLPKTESSLRRIRAIVELAGHQVISGQAGYRHARKATPEEINHFYSWMVGQARKMIQRAIRTKRFVHGIIG